MVNPPSTTAITRAVKFSDEKRHQMCTTYVFKDPKTGNHLEAWESWEPLEPSDTVPDGRTPYK